MSPPFINAPHRNGRGTLLEPDNSQYVGDWKDDIKHGKGIMTYANGDVYDGEWSRDQRCGAALCVCFPPFSIFTIFSTSDLFSHACFWVSFCVRVRMCVCAVCLCLFVCVAV